MANGQASLLMQTLSTGQCSFAARQDGRQRGATLHGGDTFYGSLPDGDPSRDSDGKHEGRAIVEVNQKRYHLHKRRRMRPTTTSRSSSRTNSGHRLRLRRHLLILLPRYTGEVPAGPEGETPVELRPLSRS